MPRIWQQLCDSREAVAGIWPQGDDCVARGLYSNDSRRFYVESEEANTMSWAKRIRKEEEKALEGEKVVADLQEPGVAATRGRKCPVVGTKRGRRNQRGKILPCIIRTEGGSTCRAESMDKRICQAEGVSRRQQRRGLLPWPANLKSSIILPASGAEEGHLCRIFSMTCSSRTFEGEAIVWNGATIIVHQCVVQVAISILPPSTLYWK